MNAALIIRRERADDGPAVRAVLQAAFGGSIEADIVEEFRASGDLILALVAEQSGIIAGYVAFPRLDLDLGERVVPVAGLAPVGVLPAFQRQGIGSALIRDGITRLTDRGERLVFALGDPGYYSRFGFEVTDGFVSQFTGPYFQVLTLAADAPAAGKVFYPQAFGLADRHTPRRKSGITPRGSRPNDAAAIRHTLRDRCR